ncbi:MAG: UDP-N-acetylmuramate:L-alanyl-gamma-D-glutamyl-meso-diaminopimelate ligase [Pseudomonadota bacterium]
MQPHHLHILGICGTFMAGIATIARELGHRVTGSDQQAYPPMSDLLAAAGIDIQLGYDPAHLHPTPDYVVIGNALTRGNPAVEFVLNNGLPYISGPDWLARHVLSQRHVLSVAGTHGKTTGSSMLAWILDHAGLNPGFLIGGRPQNFGLSARLGGDAYFVVEADEYDTAFFDKRSKFVHYRTNTLVINNVEYDHADIFPDIESIHRQFHHVVRTIPSQGHIVRPRSDPEIDTILNMGCWSKVRTFGVGDDANAISDLHAKLIKPDGSHFAVYGGGACADVDWSQFGTHNVLNALAAINAAQCVGVSLEQAADALNAFAGVSRRLEVRARVSGVTVYDDFAHHPTAIAATIDALRHRIPTDHRLIAVVEARSNTMRLGVHEDTLGPSLASADRVFSIDSDDWSVAKSLAGLGSKAQVFASTDKLLAAMVETAGDGDHFLIMSNGSFDGLHRRFIERLEAR